VWVGPRPDRRPPSGVQRRTWKRPGTDSMTLAPLLDALTASPGGEPALSRVQAALAAGTAGSASAAEVRDLSGPPGLRPFVAAALAGAGRTILAVTATDREADDLTEALGSVLGPDVVALYPSWETLPHERLSPSADTVGRRLAVLRRLTHPRARTGPGGPDDAGAGPLSVVVAPVRALLQPQIKGLGNLEPVRLRAGDAADLEEIVERLVGIAYHRVDLVERRGEIAVRGGILDVFPPTREH